MQLSAANLLIASQQIARGTVKPQPDAQAQFAAALAKEKGTEGAAFSPIEFKAATATRPAEAVPAQAPATGYNPSQRMGTTLDIRV